MPAGNIEKLPELFTTKIKNSKRWKWERAANKETTICVGILFPKSTGQDVTVTIRVEHEAAYELIDLLSLEA